MITEKVSLIDLYELLQTKQETFSETIHQTIFDLDNEESPITDPALLLKFDKSLNPKPFRPSHTNDRIDVIQGQKTWLLARLSWRRKVRHLYDNLGFPFPPIQGKDI